MLGNSSGSSSTRPRGHLSVVPPVTPPGDAGTELGRDWLEACRTRVQSRLAACPGPLDGLQGPVGLDEGEPERRFDGLPDMLAHAWTALRAWRHAEAGDTLPTVRHERLRVPGHQRR
ncbi:hypothetical protein HLB44_33085 [Aquincola sp. S2]|uniref:Uncharacterized protein n=1 Tax=Pseudaquabacterium terrae TaxID=2732868 RepID=A0ABX2ET71_9BURK|nr:hypothetical protein [Aquabacterium terrae]NRF71832.1 hypothetical protein [Aquabacterium terrae]